MDNLLHLVESALADFEAGMASTDPQCSEVNLASAQNKLKQIKLIAVQYELERQYAKLKEQNRQIDEYKAMFSELANEKKATQEYYNSLELLKTELSNELK